MAKMNGKVTNHKNGNGKNGVVTTAPRSVAISEAGIETGRDMMALHSAMIADVLAGRLDRRIAGTVIAGSRNMLKIAELTLQYGGNKGGGKMLRFDQR